MLTQVASSAIFSALSSIQKRGGSIPPLARRRSPRRPFHLGSLRYATRPAPNIFGTGATIRHQAAGLKCRYDQLQVFSRGLALAGSGQNLLDKASAARPRVSVEQRSFIGLNALEGTRQRILVLGGRVHCKGANPDNCRSQESCREITFSNLPFVLLHNPAARRSYPDCQEEKSLCLKEAKRIESAAARLFRRKRSDDCFKARVAPKRVPQRVKTQIAVSHMAPWQFCRFRQSFNCAVLVARPRINEG